MLSRFGILVLLLSVQPIFGQADIASPGVLPAEITETSGLIFYNSRLITHNDSGNTPQLFEIDTTSLAITRTVTIENVENIDWEDLAQDENYIYIGDFGNNIGARTDLAVHRIAKTDYDTSDVVTAERIEFTYEDQTDFSGNQNSDWDAEAFIVLEDQLILFTKQWQSNGTVAYAIPKTPGVHVAQNLESYNSDGLITGATFNEFSGVLFLLGYGQQLQPFVIRIEGITSVFNFGGTIEKISLSIGLAQVEGITHTDENTYFLSSERFVNNSPPITLDSRLFRFTTEDTTGGENPEEPDPGENPEEPDPGENPEEPDPGENEGDLIIYGGPGDRQIQYNLNVDSELFGMAVFDTAGRRLFMSQASEIEGTTVDLSVATSGIYYLTFYMRGQTISKPFFLN